LAAALGLGHVLQHTGLTTKRSLRQSLDLQNGRRPDKPAAAVHLREVNVDYLERFRVQPGASVKLKDIDPAFKDRHEHREQAAEEIAHYQEKLRELQVLLYAERRHSLLICLQAMDTGGKDGTINHVLGAMNPQGCRVAAFRQPSAEEAAHDFLWRVHQAAPERGEVVIFNRSHYEDVLVVRVHRLVPKDVWSRRYERINAFEKGLIEHDTHVLKFYLHISKEEQLTRFKDRLDDPAKHWKISESDYKERAFWDDYMEAYEEALSRCSTEHAPWFVIPANHKWFRNLAVARIIVEHLEGLKMKYPKPVVDIEHIRREYHAAKQT
jgi:PPK2 family polyphosphate:nucleotide phosphotransferase